MCVCVSLLSVGLLRRTRLRMGGKTWLGSRYAAAVGWLGQDGGRGLPTRMELD
jgi:hydrogenase maturation factor HypE